MDWIDTRALSRLVGLLVVFWIVGVGFMWFRNDTRPEAKEYWSKLKDFAWHTFLTTAIGGLMLIIILGPVAILWLLLKRFVL